MNELTAILSGQAGAQGLELSEALAAQFTGGKRGLSNDPPISSVAAVPLVAGPSVPRAGERKRALKLWEIHHKYHCPIVGTCLHVDELRRLAQRFEGWAEDSLSDYEIHVSFVGAAETKNSVSIAAQKRLDRKYPAHLCHFSRAKTPEELEALWREAVASGDVPGALWALMSHPYADQRLRALAYEDVHMLSHQIGAGHCTEARVLAETRARLAAVERARAEEARRFAQRLADRDRLLTALKAQLGRANETLRRQQQQKGQRATDKSGDLARRTDTRVEELRAEVKRLQVGYERATLEGQRLSEEFERATEQISRLSAELDDRQAAAEALERILLCQQSSAQAVSGCAGGDACRACVDLQGRRILCVGGRGTLAEHYRELVARCNGELVRHDGGLEDSDRRLEAMMAAADAVVCPADFVSHNAYYRAKRFCKRHSKPCILLRSSGISSFARALEQLAA